MRLRFIDVGAIHELPLQRIGLSKYSSVHLQEGLTLATHKQAKIEPSDDIKDE
ncbi:hypothetical protein [Cylindrospermum sp. FACHB-282]|uniref:hypothetical protein n=1 Tax=Cylindrospermum sp. FACHB-282 TaxID=2692794 RepID=UPI0016842316|nr:hypothetical protein [Cylindrospermum sp. FACHB-282]MBD2385927.1 hypothetical protein [Cylindrospermum sp. FACHB-282]